MQQKQNQNAVIQRLKIFLESSAISNAMLSEATGMSTAAVSRILTGKVDPHKSTIQKIVKCYPKINPEWLFTGNGEMLQEASSNIDWKEEAYMVMKEENSFLKKQLELLNNVVNTLLNGKNPNFPPSPLHVGKVLSLFGEGTCAGDYNLAQVG